MNNSAEILFEYLRSILFDRKIKKLDKNFIDADHQDLAEGLEYAAGCVEEMTAYSGALSTGNLSAEFPKDHNELCLNLKNMHANLNHLTWQAQRVAEGDYSQRVSYLGEFSVAFNKMIDQLSEREDLMKREAEAAETRAKLFQSYNDLLIALTEHRREWILVIDEKTSKVLYCNKHNNDVDMKDKNFSPETVCNNCQNSLDIKDLLLSYTGKGHDELWETQGPDSQRWFQIHSYEIVWEGTAAYVHIVEDITVEKNEEKYLSDMAYKDAGTGLFNRRYITEMMDELIQQDATFSFAFIDVDGLKYVNDNFGHQEGDVYLKAVGDALVNTVRDKDIVARIGGDEFGIVLVDCPADTAETKIAGLYEKMFRSSVVSEYRQGFAYGTVQRNHGDKMTSEEIVEEADGRMYKCKRTHKSRYNNGR